MILNPNSSNPPLEFKGQIVSKKKLTFSCQCSRKWCQRGQQKQMWKTGGHNCNLGYANMSNAVSTSMLLFVSRMIVSIVSGNTDPSILPLECLQSLPFPCSTWPKNHRNKKRIKIIPIEAFHKGGKEEEEDLKHSLPHKKIWSPSLKPIFSKLKKRIVICIIIVIIIIIIIIIVGGFPIYYW